jgi:uncharacterized membrane protein YcaP (DUF421 family)
MEWLTEIDWERALVPHTSLLEIVIRGSGIYLGLYLILRVLMKRQSGTLGITDLLVIVLIADAAQNGMADDYTSITDGLVLVLVIVGWAWILDWASYRFRWFEDLIRPTPLMLIDRGRVNRDAMRRELVSMGELRSQLREQGVDDISTVKSACMEPDGRLSVVTFDKDSHQAPEPQS